VRSMEMTEQEIIAAAKTNWLAWQGLRELQPEVAAWMEGHKEDCRVLQYYDGVMLDADRVAFDCAGSVYRLRPDYEPERWWFCAKTLKVFTNGSAIEPCEDCVEVTPEYAEYLRNKPDGEWELRMAKAGDETNECFKLPCDLEDCGPSDRGYRWCKPKQPEAGWREYRLEARNGVYYVKGYRGGDMALHKALCRVGFGGVQFEGCDAWSMLVAAYRRDETLYIYDSGEIPSVTATPIKVRFWVAQ
jgi:hypothetical protein